MKKFIFLALLILSIFLGYYIFQLKNKEKKRNNNHSKAEKIIFSAYGIKISYFNKKDSLLYILNSPKLIKYNINYRKIFKYPKLIAYNNNNKIWDGSADIVYLSSDNLNMYLDKNVVITNYSNNKNTIQIKASKMSYNRNLNILKSNYPVQIKNNIVKQISNNFEYDMLRKKMYFKGDINSIFKTK